MTLYTLYALYVEEKFAARSGQQGVEQFESMKAAQDWLAVTAIVMVFKLLYVSTLQQTLGVFVLMVMRMIQDLAVFLMLFAVMAIGFMITMHSLFYNVDGYYTYSETITTLVSSALGGFDFGPLQVHFDGSLFMVAQLIADRKHPRGESLVLPIGPEPFCSACICCSTWCCC